MDSLLSLAQIWTWDLSSLLKSTVLLMLGSLLLVAVVAKFFNSQVTICKNLTTRFDGKTIVITGGTKGVGFEASRQFLSRGCRLVIGDPDPDHARQVADVLQKDVAGCGSVVVLQLDLSCMSSVRKFADKILRTEKSLDVLVLNACVPASRTKQTTAEGFERTMAANYLGHFLLTNLLFGLMKVTSNSRVVVTVSQLYSLLRNINPTDLLFKDERYTVIRANALSQVCLVLFTRHFAILASRYGVLVNCFSPGFVRTDDYDKSVDFVTGRLRYWAAMVVGRTAFQGSQTLLFLATAGEGTCASAGYFVDCHSRQLSELVSNDGLARKVFEATEDIVKLTKQEKRYY
uniref:Retinol dehydrogenase 14-like isoform X1 n=1 Tax=Hirondellea gigas TaxID=1518452 RepID=A0A6A7G352_9CRUS